MLSKPKAKDDADIAAEQEDRMREEALWRVRKAEALPMRGKCFNCDEPTSGRFCDANCRVDYERQKASERRSGC
jgi:hypothetical protein